MLAGLSSVALAMWIDDPILRERSCRARALRWCKCLTPVLSSRNEGEAPHQPLSFSLTFCIASNTLKSCVFTCASQDEKKKKTPRLYWVGGGEFLVRRLCERCLFSHKSSGDSPLLSLSAVNQHRRTADGRLCLAGAHILGAYCCPQRWGCQGRMLPRVQGNIIFHIISEQ